MEIERIMSGEAGGRRAGLLRALMTLAEPGYEAIITVRNVRYNRRTPTPLGRPTISVGNLTAGGTGKTPMVTHLAHLLLDSGRRPAILLRGYGGDESREYAHTFGDRVPVEPNPDRLAGAAAVLERAPATDIFLLDDAFQHRRVARDLDLVLIDATRPFGYDHLLPRGLLREPLTSLRRADAVIVTRADTLCPGDLDTLDATLEHHHGRPPLAHAAYRWAPDTAAALAGRPVYAITGLGNPDAFARHLLDTGAKLLHHHRLPDHFAYTPAVLKRWFQDARERGAAHVVTTMKDRVKWPDEVKNWGPPIVVPSLRVDFLDGGDALTQHVLDIGVLA